MYQKKFSKCSFKYFVIARRCDLCPIFLYNMGARYYQNLMTINEFGCCFVLVIVVAYSPTGIPYLLYIYTLFQPIIYNLKKQKPHFNFILCLTIIFKTKQNLFVYKAGGHLLILFFFFFWLFVVQKSYEISFIFIKSHKHKWVGVVG